MTNPTYKEVMGIPWEESKERWKFDRPIRDLLEDLNLNNLYTFASCSGHPERGKEWDRCQIYFKKVLDNEDKKKLEQILNSHGIFEFKTKTKQQWFPRKGIVKYTELLAPTVI